MQAEAHTGHPRLGYRVSDLNGARQMMIRGHQGPRQWSLFRRRMMPAHGAAVQVHGTLDADVAPHTHPIHDALTPTRSCQCQVGP